MRVVIVAIKHRQTTGQNSPNHTKKVCNNASDGDIIINKSLISIEPLLTLLILASQPEQVDYEQYLYEKAPIMKEVAWCESRNRQYDENGDVLIGFSGADKGLFQINKLHWNKARQMGINLNTRQGNARYALYLYEKYGTDPWYMSADCWGRFAKN